jgi:hypothetical protein
LKDHVVARERLIAITEDRKMRLFEFSFDEGDSIEVQRLRATARDERNRSAGSCVMVAGNLASGKSEQTPE